MMGQHWGNLPWLLDAIGTHFQGPARVDDRLSLGRLPQSRKKPGRNINAGGYRHVEIADPRALGQERKYAQLLGIAPVDRSDLPHCWHWRRAQAFRMADRGGGPELAQRCRQVPVPMPDF